jgi:cytoskeletal protein CcmA (bactofilin family)
VSADTRSPATIIGRGMRVEGRVQFSGALLVEGSVQGEVRGSGEAPATLALGREGRIVGSVAAVDLRSQGRIEGSITEAGAVELLQESTTSGELSYESLEVRRGAVLDCVLRPLTPGAEASSPPGR